MGLQLVVIQTTTKDSSHENQYSQENLCEISVPHL